MLFAIGTLAPIVLTLLNKIETILRQMGWSSWLTSIPMTEIGYVLLATAGALVVFDQFFDASGSWIRFRQSQARLEVLLADFRFSWAKSMAQTQGAQTTRDPVVPFTWLLRDFVIKVELLAEDETAQWAKRFSEMIDSFDRNPNLKVTVGSANADSLGNRRSTDATSDSGNGDVASQGAPGAAGTAPAPGNAPQRDRAATADTAVTIRLAIVGAVTLDSGSLQLFVDEELRPVPPDGLVELQLDAGHSHTVVATGRRNGQTLRDEFHEDITIDDENKSFALQL